MEFLTAIIVFVLSALQIHAKQEPPAPRPPCEPVAIAQPAPEAEPNAQPLCPACPAKPACPEPQAQAGDFERIETLHQQRMAEIEATLDRLHTTPMNARIAAVEALHPATLSPADLPRLTVDSLRPAELPGEPTSPLALDLPGLPAAGKQTLSVAAGPNGVSVASAWKDTRGLSVQVVNGRITVTQMVNGQQRLSQFASAADLKTRDPGLYELCLPMLGR